MLRTAVFSLLASLCSTVQSAETITFHHENVLGTSLEIKLNAKSQDAAIAAEKRVLSEIDRLALIFSTYDEKSEMRKWMDGESTGTEASKELLELFRMCEDQWKISDGAFDPRVGPMIEVWRKGAATQKEPTEGDLQAAIKLSKDQAWRIDERQKTVHRMTKMPLTFDGIAKGLIVDHACSAALKSEGIEGVLVNIGGDLRVAGTLQDQVLIADPMSPAKSITALMLSDKAIATSGNYQRGFKIGQQLHSHIIDPRTGKPVDHVISASVIAETAAIADALATAFSVLPVERSIEICNGQPQLACLLITVDGKKHSSVGWPTSENESGGNNSTAETVQSSKGKANWKSGAELQVDFEINRADGRRYRRPYLAVWIEDKNQVPIKTLTLWLQAENPGPRWHRDLKRWYKQNGSRKLANGSNLIGTISAATKPPGVYKTVWEGKDDNGKLVSQGKYTLFLEVAREHGTYQLMSKEVIIGDQATKGDLGQNAEIKSVHFEYLLKGTDK